MKKYLRPCVSRTGSQTVFTWSPWGSPGLLVKHALPWGQDDHLSCFGQDGPVLRMWAFCAKNQTRTVPGQTRVVGHPTPEPLWIARVRQSALKQTLQKIILSIQKSESHYTRYGNELLKELVTSFWRYWEKIDFHLFGYVWFCLKLR